ncbi:MAG TPA: hypothetical protein VK501_14910 [Baekduia sp.]|uniref:hypothetical protein n=1 Tax=Baekduia sp. TaxID=2600305 RepID=UPI002CE85315|nr:hypothetical protein [Baekduia sp.]HMJ35199.1 hypothetical protein [Baekduia sp.]
MAATLDLLPDAAEQVLAVVAPPRSPGARPSTGPGSWTRRELLLWWRDRNHRDPIGGVRLDWDDDVERVAIAQHYHTWNTPEQVVSLIGSASSRAAMGDLWAALRPHDRQLYRRRAAVLLALALALADKITL